MPSEYIPVSLRRRLRERAKRSCEYCQLPDKFIPSFHCDHIIPQKVGGKTELGNLAWACPWCNTHKHAKTHARDPWSGQLVSLFNPRLEQWRHHFMWSDDFLFIIGRTQTGRATVAALNMNRPEHINLRRALRLAGEQTSL